MDDDTALVVDSVFPDAIITPSSITLTFADPSENNNTISLKCAYPDLGLSITSSSRNNDCRKTILNFSAFLHESLMPLTDLLDILTTAQALTSELWDELESTQPLPLPVLPLPSRHSSQPRCISVMYSHHIIAKSKLALIKQLAKELSLSGVLKKGWPGFIVVEGRGGDVDVFFMEMKKLQWQHFQERGRIQASTQTEAQMDTAQMDAEADTFPQAFQVLEETSEFSTFVRSLTGGEAILKLAFGL